jgi:hypothetical protein
MSEECKNEKTTKKTEPEWKADKSQILKIKESIRKHKEEES